MSHIFTEDRQYVLPVYKRLSLEIIKGKGSILTDVRHKKYLDMYAGIAVSALGHQHPKMLKAIKSQSKHYLHLSNYFVSKPVVDLARKLVEHSFASKVFFANSGAEANEAAIKLAKKYGKTIHPQKTEFIALSESFHGRTLGGLSLTSQPKYKAVFEPLLPGVHEVKRNSVEELNQVATDNICAIFLEVIQGESGVQELTPEFLDAVSTLSEKHQFLVIVDEVQSGLMRTGKLFAYEHTSLVPDAMTLAKSLGGGIPLGALLIHPKYEHILVPGDHGSTFGGNPLACAMGNVVIDEITKPGFQEELLKKSEYILSSLHTLQAKYPSIIRKIKGKGFMIGIDVGSHAFTLQQKALEKQLLINVTNQDTIRLLPALNIPFKEVIRFVELFSSLVGDLAGGLQ